MGSPCDVKTSLTVHAICYVTLHTLTLRANGCQQHIESMVPRVVELCERAGLACAQECTLSKELAAIGHCNATNSCGCS